MVYIRMLIENLNLDYTNWNKTNKKLISPLPSVGR